MFIRKNRISVLLIVVFSMQAYFSQAQYISGYLKDVKGEILRYECQQPDADSSLLVRSLNKEKFIEWETAPIPPEFQGNSVKFVWIAGIDVNPDDPHIFNLFVNNKKLFSFSSPLDTVVKEWTQTAPNGMELSFKSTLVDKYGDLFGYMFLKIPNKLKKQGKSFKIKVVGESAGSRTWFMIFRYVAKQGAKIRQEKAVVKNDGKQFQSLRVDILHFGEPTTANVTIGEHNTSLPVSLGLNIEYVEIPVVSKNETYNAEIIMNDSILLKKVINVKPVKHYDIYLLPHSHVDIGYTQVQSEVEKTQKENITKAIEIAEKSSKLPAEAQFRWNTEVMWPVECYLKNATEEEKETFINAVQKGWIELDGIYANLLTELCRPEELYRAFEYGKEVGEVCDVEIKSAMMSDIPGTTWGIIPVMAQNGIKYFSIGTNTFERIGDIIEKLGDKPFYWQSPSGEEKVLCWVHGKGYSEFHTGLGYGKMYNTLKEQRIMKYIDELETNHYPYDMVVMRYNIGSDNGPPDENLPDIVKKWNEKFVTPTLHISTVSESFSKFEKMYGSRLPVLKGELTGYWEDGSGSTAKETALNLASSERLVQSEILYTMLDPENYPKEKFDSAWRNVLLFTEHTWGAWNSVSEPEDKFVRQQWKTKQSFALEADRQSRALLKDAVKPDMAETIRIIDVYNTSSWKRTDLVTIPKEYYLSESGVRDRVGNIYLSQRLTSGEFVFLAEDVPALAAKRFYIFDNTNSLTQKENMFSETKFENSLVRFDINNQSGNITFLRFKNVPFNSSNLVTGLNSYLYVLGRNPQSYSKNGIPFTDIKESGPLVFSYLIESDAPGCNSLTREVRVIDKIQRLDIINTIDKKDILDPEGAYFQFPYKLPGGILNLGLAWGHYQPDKDQLPGSNKNFFTIQRWADISNEQFGITFTVKEAPIIEIGRLTTDANEVGWIKEVPESTTLFSYVMNNYWGTNYKASQSGKVSFSYSIYPHNEFDPVFAEKCGIEQNQPLIAVPASESKPVLKQLFTLTNNNVIVTLLKPVDDGNGILVRLYNPGNEVETVSFNFSLDKRKVYLSDPYGENRRKVKNEFVIPPLGIRTVVIRGL
jgi:hypothetical protein